MEALWKCVGEMTVRAGMEEAVEMAGTAPVIPRNLVAPRSTGCGKEEEHGGVPGSGDSHPPRSRGQGCRRTPAGRCHRAARCEALQKREEKLRGGSTWG